MSIVSGPKMFIRVLRSVMNEKVILFSSINISLTVFSCQLKRNLVKPIQTYLVPCLVKEIVKKQFFTVVVEMPRKAVNKVNQQHRVKKMYPDSDIDVQYANEQVQANAPPLNLYEPVK